MDEMRRAGRRLAGGLIPGAMRAERIAAGRAGFGYWGQPLRDVGTRGIARRQCVGPPRRAGAENESGCSRVIPEINTESTTVSMIIDGAFE